MVEVKIPLSSVFVRHKYAQHGGCEWRESHCPWYYMYLISESIDLPDAISFAYRDSIHAGCRTHALSVEEVVRDGEAAVDAVNSQRVMFEDNSEKNAKLSEPNPETGSGPQEK